MLMHVSSLWAYDLFAACVVGNIVQDSVLTVQKYVKPLGLWHGGTLHVCIWPWSFVNMIDWHKDCNVTMKLWYVLFILPPCWSTGPLHTSAEVLQDNKSWDSTFGSGKNMLLQLMALLLIVTSDHSMLYVKTLHVQVQWLLCIQKQCFMSRKNGKACQAKLASELGNLKHVPPTKVCGYWCIQIMIFLLDDDKHGHACAANETFMSSIYICVFFLPVQCHHFRYFETQKYLWSTKKIKHWNLANAVVKSWTSSTSTCTWYPAEHLIFH